MNETNNTDYAHFTQIIKWAKKRGYKMPPLEQAVFDSKGEEPLRASLRRWAQGMLFDHDFAKAVFGEEQVDEYGQDFYAIHILAVQTAIEHAGKLYNVRPDQRQVVMLEQPMVAHIEELSKVNPADTTLEQPKKVVYDIEKLVGQIPFKTHQIKAIEIDGGQPAWQYHIKQMAVSADPFVYICEYIDKQETITD